jgi:hypothetical protein
MEEKKVWLFLHQSTGFETLEEIQTLEPSRRIERDHGFNIRLMEYGRGSWKGPFRLPFSVTSRSPRGLKATGRNIGKAERGRAQSVPDHPTS